MNRKPFSFHILLLSLSLLITTMGATYAYASNPANAQSKQADVRGTWSGTLFPKHSNVAPFTITVVITPDSRGHLIGTSTLSSDCLKDVRLEVTVEGSTVVLSGSDESGDNITVRGTIDKTGTQLKASYILNGSATGRCETDNGTGNLSKR